MARVIFLEDAEDLVEFLPLFLKERGLDVVSTTSIAEALEVFAQDDFDAVLLDIMMPPADDMDAEQLGYGRETGVEVARRMKAVKPDVPIVGFTVTTDRKIWAEMREAGIATIINKPSEPDRIANILWQVIQSKL